MGCNFDTRASKRAASDDLGEKSTWIKGNAGVTPNNRNFQRIQELVPREKLKLKGRQPGDNLLGYIQSISSHHSGRLHSGIT